MEVKKWGSKGATNQGLWLLELKKNFQKYFSLMDRKEWNEELKLERKGGNGESYNIMAEDQVLRA